MKKSDLETHIANLIEAGRYDIIRRDTGLMVIGGQYVHFTGKHISFGYRDTIKISKPLQKMIRYVFDHTTGEATVH